MRYFLALVLVVASLLGSPASASASVQAGDSSAHSRTVVPGPRWCTERNWGPRRAIPEPRRQRAVARKARGVTDDDFVVQRARPTRIGVVALVSGDLKKARSVLSFVDHVGPWAARDINGFPPGQRVDIYTSDVVGRELDKALASVEDVEGLTSPAVWSAGGSAVIAWKAPVPDRVLALAGVTGTGVEVRIVPRELSGADLVDGMDRLIRFLARRDIFWSSMTSCRSDAGIELGLPGDPADLPVSEERLARAAGMRVSVGGGVMVAPARTTGG